MAGVRGEDGESTVAGQEPSHTGLLGVLAAGAAPEPLKVAVSAIEAEFVCPLCQYPAENAVQLKSCGHFFCQTCCDEMVRRRVSACMAAGCRVPFRHLDIMSSHTTRNILDICSSFKL